MPHQGGKGSPRFLFHIDSTDSGLPALLNEKIIVVAVQFVYPGIILDSKSGGLGIYPQKRIHLIFGNCRESIDVGKFTNSV